MSELSFKFEPKEKQLEIVFCGDVLSSNVKELSEIIEKELEALKNEDWGVLFLNLGEAKLVDSMGLNLIISLLKHAQMRKSQVKCKIASRTIHRTLLFTRLDKQMEIEFCKLPNAKKK